MGSSSGTKYEGKDHIYYIKLISNLLTTPDTKLLESYITEAIDDTSITKVIIEQGPKNLRLHSEALGQINRLKNSAYIGREIEIGFIGLRGTLYTLLETRKILGLIKQYPSLEEAVQD